ncbi:MAG: hypothetical protein COT74_10690 [Bdellovibrionales bacterium CG10_big_fil_rev_8_21_14_0_10_45_34]|nr:MAG: hypothetical protein COT74_10690 [Bdellovibrionales bacterium CG10_big_fil_rev_8_21_14_0_10_45_34]
MGAKKDTHFSHPDFLLLLKNRDSAAVSKLVTAYTEHLYKAALGLGFDEPNSEELVQRVWSTFFDVVASFEGRSHIRTFIFGIMYNKASELRREEKKYSANDPIEEVMESRFAEDGHWANPPTDPEKFMASTQMMALIQKCIDRLPLSQRMAFCLKEIDDHGSSDICKILEVSVTNLGVLLYRARNRLRECIESKS